MSVTVSDTLGVLADPTQFNGPIELDNRSTENLLEQVRDILLIRYAEEAVAELAAAGEAKCPCHLGIGQEAVEMAGELAVSFGHRR